MLNLYVRPLLLGFLFLMLYGFFAPAYAQAVDRDKISALREAADQRWSRAFTLAQKTNDPVIMDTVEWLYLTQARTVDRSFDQIKKFLDKKPEWPSRRMLLLQAEERLPQSFTAHEVVGWFRKNPPLTLNGHIRYIRALERVSPNEARAHARKVWTGTNMEISQQQDFLNQFKDYLSKKDHEDRLDFLVWEGEHRKAQQILGLVDLPYRLTIQARIKLAQSDAGVDHAIRSVNPEYESDAGLIYERVKWRRQKGLNDGAIELLMKPVQNVKRRDLMWRERHVIARRLMEQKDFERAYRLVAAHEQLEGFPFAEAEWLAGWLSLNFLNDPMRGFRHFYAMYEKVNTALSKSRAAYWAGMASLKAGDQRIAKQWLAVAARYSTLFYGQLATVKLRELDKNYRISLLPIAPEPTWQDRKKFNDSYFVRVLNYMNEARFSRTRDIIFSHLIETSRNPVDFVLLSEFAEKNGNYDLSIKVSKEALNKGVMLLHAGYPVLPSNESARIGRVEKALVHAIIRQESAFKVDARSNVGALGLMQLMPGTAREVSQKLGLSYSQSRLVTDRAYNVQLGAEYINQMIRRYDGYYPMAIAAYNAGPGRISSIIRQVGDPRKGEIDMVDWIEMIPIYETRNYVHRVLEAMHVYRMKLSEETYYAQNVNAYEGVQ